MIQPVRLLLYTLMLGQVTASYRGIDYRQCPRRFPNDADNVCNDPIHTDVDNDASFSWNPRSIDEPFIQNLLSISRLFHHILANELRHFETANLPCVQVKDSLQQITISDLIRVRFCTPYNVQNNYTRMFADIAEATQLLRFVATVEAERCCFSVEQLHLTMKNQLLSHWYAIYRSLGVSLQPRRCHIKIDPISINALRCEDIRNLVYVILRHALGLTGYSVRLLEQMILSQPGLY